METLETFMHYSIKGKGVHSLTVHFSCPCFACLFCKEEYFLVKKGSFSLFSNYKTFF